MVQMPKSWLRMVLYFILIICFSYTIDFAISLLVSNVATILLPKLRSTIGFNQNVLGFLGIIIIRLSQYVTLFVSGCILCILCHVQKKPLIYAFFLACIFDVPSFGTLILNFESLYGDKIIYVLGYLCVLLIDIFSAFVGILLGRFLSQRYGTFGTYPSLTDTSKRNIQ
jgi:uncharacterized membrane protein YozB (DUF420 family)